MRNDRHDRIKLIVEAHFSCYPEFEERRLLFWLHTPLAFQFRGTWFARITSFEFAFAGDSELEVSNGDLGVVNRRVLPSVEEMYGRRRSNHLAATAVLCNCIYANLMELLKGFSHRVGLRVLLSFFLRLVVLIPKFAGGCFLAFEQLQMILQCFNPDFKYFHAF